MYVVVVLNVNLLVIQRFPTNSAFQLVTAAGSVALSVRFNAQAFAPAVVTVHILSWPLLARHVACGLMRLTGKTHTTVRSCVRAPLAHWKPVVS